MTEKKEQNSRLLAIGMLSVLFLLFAVCIAPVAADPLPEPNHVFIKVANDAGVKYDLDGAVFGTEGNNNTYYIKAEGGGLNELCLTADPAVPTGQITVSNQQSGTFYVTAASGKGYFDDIIMAIAVNGTIPDDFAVYIKSSGYNWTPSSSPSNYTYMPGVVDEVFTKEDFIYGPQVLRPCPPQNGLQPFVYGLDKNDTTNTFQFMFVDLHAGSLIKTLPGIDDEGQGAVKVEYTFENLETTAAFNVYGWCLYAGQGQGISWTNDLLDKARGGSNGYSVVGIPPVLASINVTPAVADLKVHEILEFNEKQQFNATALDQNDRPMTGLTFEWSSSNETVGTVNKTGYFTAHAAGTTTITAANGTVEGTATAIVTAPATMVIPSNKDTLLRISNSESARFDDYGNNTYRFFNPTQSGTQGLNALHITTDASKVNGQVTFSNDLSGVFYLTDTGGRGWDDNGILMLAVNGTIPDDFRVHIKASGYQWMPVPKGTFPAFDSIKYIPDALDETFTKDDFLYGPQIWRPCPAVNYPIFDGQDMTDTENTFSIMFIDLNAGLLGKNTLSKPDFSGKSIPDNGAVRVEYSFENLESFAAFNAYVYTVSSNQGQGVSWTNRLSAVDSSGYAVVPLHGDQTKDSSLDIPGCTVTKKDDGKQEVSINTMETNAALSGSTIQINEGTFILTIETESAPQVQDGMMNGTVTGIALKTKPITTALDDVGTVSASIAANLTGIPSGAALQTTVSASVSADAQSAFQLAAATDGLNVGAIAYTMNIKKTNLANGQDVSDATIRMAVSPVWVDTHGGVGTVRIIRSAEDGTKEVLKTVLVGTDADGNMVFEAFSPKGLSVFGLTAVSTAPSGGETGPSHSSGGSTSDVAAISGSIPAGETKSFAVTQTAISRITVVAWDAIDDMLVTVQKASLPKGVEAPSQTTFEVIETTLYRVDPSAIDTVTLEFAVPTAWLKEHDLSTDNIVILSYEKDAWKPLKTSFLKEENGQALYSAEASGFSYFAIAAGTTASAGQQVGETVTSTVTETAETTPPTTTAPTTQKSPVFWALPLVAFGLLFLFGKRE
jgi:PGF-pre-PGF domain-containing protein